jgi:lysozyme
MNAQKKRAAAGLGAAVIALAAPVVMYFEGLETKPYVDPVGIPTVCYGETHVEMRAYTVDECKAMLMDSMAKHGAQIAPCMPEALPDHQKAAALSFGYNVGAGAFCGSTFAKKLKAGDPTACAELSRWTYAGGKELPGLVKRRAAERAMCEGKA